MASVVGIDLGTTNTVVGVVQSGEAYAISDDDSNKLIPSVVSFHPNGTVLVGRAAKARRLLDAANTVYSIKRLIGRSWNSDEVRLARSRFPFEMREGPGQAALVVARGESFTLPEISAFVLRKAKAVAEKTLGDMVERAVITVPANFNDLQRAATKVAGRVAGLEVLRILNEPTAAALAYGYGKGSQERIAIYDFGGGTFDMTLLDLSGNVFEVLATAGNTFLGGDDIDLAIAERMSDACLKQHGYDARNDAQGFERLRAAAEKLKMDLSASENASTHVKELAHGAAGKPIHFDFAMTRAELNALIGPIVEKTFDVCREAMEIARLKVGDFDHTLLVGGSTRVPLVRERVEAFFGKRPRDDVNPEEVVAVGAAIQASALSGGEKRRSLIPKPPMPAARATAGGRRKSEPPGRSTLAGTNPGLGKDPPRVKMGTLPGVTGTPGGAMREKPGTEPGLGAAFRAAMKPASVRPAPPQGPEPAAPMALPIIGVGAPATGSPKRPSPEQAAPDLPLVNPGAGDLKPLTKTVSPRTAPARAAPRPSPDEAWELPQVDSADPDEVPTEVQRLPDLEKYGDVEQVTTVQQAPADLISQISKAEPLADDRPRRAPSQPKVDPLEAVAEPRRAPEPPSPPAEPPKPERPVIKPYATFEPPRSEPIKPAAEVPKPPPPAVEPERPMFHQAATPEPGGTFDIPDRKTDPGLFPGLPPAQPQQSPSQAGAAYGQALAAQRPKGPAMPVLVDVTPLSLSVETVGGYCDHVIPRNTPVPCEQTRPFVTAQDNQTSVRIRVGQGESRRFEENTVLGQVDLLELRAARRNEVQIAVTFALDTDGMLSVRARDVATGKATETRIRLVGLPETGDISAMQKRHEARAAG